MFITNKHNVNENPAEPASMSARIREIVPVTETLSILSGYFYFNGIPPLVEPIAANKDLKLKILVGLDVDRKGYELAHAGDGDTAQEKFKNSLRNYARSKMFDEERCALSMETFLKMMEEGRFAIRKTKEPNHAKLYVFEMQAAIGNATDPIRSLRKSSRPSAICNRRSTPFKKDSIMIKNPKKLIEVALPLKVINEARVVI